MTPSGTLTPSGKSSAAEATTLAALAAEPPAASSELPPPANDESDTEIGNDSDEGEGDHDAHNETPNNNKGLSEHELLRLRNIERNSEHLKALGLWKLSVEGNTSARTSTAKRKRLPIIPTRRSPIIPTRRLGRLQSIPSAVQ